MFKVTYYDSKVYFSLKDIQLQCSLILDEPYTIEYNPSSEIGNIIGPIMYKQHDLFDCNISNTIFISKTFLIPRHSMIYTIPEHIQNRDNIGWSGIVIFPSIYLPNNIIGFALHTHNLYR